MCGAQALLVVPPCPPPPRTRTHARARARTHARTHTRTHTVHLLPKEDVVHALDPLHERVVLHTVDVHVGGFAHFEVCRGTSARGPPPPPLRPQLRTPHTCLPGWPPRTCKRQTGRATRCCASAARAATASARRHAPGTEWGSRAQGACNRLRRGLRETRKASNGAHALSLCASLPHARLLVLACPAPITLTGGRCSQSRRLAAPAAC